MTTKALLLRSMTAVAAPSRKTLSKIVWNRLQKELVEWQVNALVCFKHKDKAALINFSLDWWEASCIWLSSPYSLKVCLTNPIVQVLKAIE
ncbi:ubiquitin-conjugating enzyme 15-like [Phalaenopsis equestris]|uniref:ubiquitin-conjugating enzyme 15-like n=1 Tax=Phalaenopsis equestris TaxID=78828 RepID=UPI0009E2CE7B|nr:ubiquitin-conjugating enzyme 15-like [Phalaenopsis equestris]